MHRVVFIVLIARGTTQPDMSITVKETHSLVSLQGQRWSCFQNPADLAALVYPQGLRVIVTVCLRCLHGGRCILRLPGGKQLLSSGLHAHVPCSLREFRW